MLPVPLFGHICDIYLGGYPAGMAVLFSMVPIFFHPNIRVKSVLISRLIATQTIALIPFPWTIGLTNSHRQASQPYLKIYD